MLQCDFALQNGVQDQARRSSERRGYRIGRFEVGALEKNRAEGAKTAVVARSSRGASAHSAPFRESAGARFTSR